MGNWDVSKPHKDGKPCGDTISRRAVHEAITRWAGSMSVLTALPTREVRPLLDSIHELPTVTPQEPSNDMVSLGVFEQVMWERDVAIDQLKQLGYGFGEKIRTDDDSISRQAALDCLTATKLKKFDFILCAREEIKKLPSVNPKQRTGHWIETAEEYYKAVNEYGGGVNEDTPYFVDDIACSECLSMFSIIDNETERFDYCPHCGSKNVEPQERSEE